MISVDEALEYHNGVIDEFGGSKGIRDKATAIFENLIINHPFIDGNKRTAYVLLRLTLLDDDFDIDADQDEKYSMSIAASMGEINFDQIKEWLSQRLIKIQ